MDIEQAAQLAIQKLVASGKIEEAIEKQIAETVCRTVADALGRYSDFGKSLEEAVKKSLQLHGDLELESYSDTVLKIVRAQLKGRANAIIEQQVADNMSRLLTPAPESITLSQLIAEYVEFVKERAQHGCVCYGDRHGVTCYVEDSDRNEFRTIYLDDEPDKKRSECDIHIGTYKGQVYTLRLGGSRVEQEMFAGPFYGFHESLFKMHVAKTRIEFDARPEDLDLDYEVNE